MAEKTIDVAQESSVQEVNEKIGSTGDTGGSTTAGSFFAKLNAILTNWTSTRAGYIDTIKTNTDRMTSARATKIDNIGATGDTGGSATAGTVMGKLNQLITDLTTHIEVWTSTRAGYVDNIRSYTVTNNTASKTGVLSAKLAYVISLLENTTYGLSALKTASGSSVVKSVQRGVIILDSDYDESNTATISPVTTSKTIVLYTGNTNTSSTDSQRHFEVQLVLTDSTTITASRYGDSGKVTIPYQVIEFY